MSNSSLSEPLLEGQSEYTLPSDSDDVRNQSIFSHTWLVRLGILTVGILMYHLSQYGILIIHQIIIHENMDENGEPLLPPSKLYSWIIMDVIWPIFILCIIKFFKQKEKSWKLRVATIIIPALILLALTFLKDNYFDLPWKYNFLCVACYFILAISY